MGAEKFLLVKGITGLGDRILCALGGILYARLSERTLVVDWSDSLYSSGGDNVFHRFFKSQSCSPTDEIPTTDSVYPAIWRDRLHEPAQRIADKYGYNPDDILRELSIDLSRLDYQEDLLVLVQFDARVDRLRTQLRTQFHGPLEELAQMPDQAILAKLLREDMVLQPEIRERVNEFKGNSFAARTVGVHVRYSDYRVRVLAIIKQLNALLERERGLQIFLATDNIEIKKMFESNYPRVITTPHWYADPGWPIHYNRASPDRTEFWSADPGGSIHYNRPSPDRTELAIEALIDLYLLAECSHLIVDESSSFSELASLLSSAPADNKIDVATRGKGNRRIRHAVTRIMRRVRFSSWAFRLLPKLVPIRRL